MPLFRISLFSIIFEMAALTQLYRMPLGKWHFGGSKTVQIPVQSYCCHLQYQYKTQTIWEKEACPCCCLVIKPCPTLRDPMDQSTPGPPVFHCFQELGQVHVGSFGDTVHPSRPLSSTSPLAFTLSQHQGLFQGVFSSHQMAKVLEPQLQDLSYQ